MMDMNMKRDWLALIGRVALATLFVTFGWMKIASFSAMSGYAASSGVPMPDIAIWISIVIELLGGLMIVFGFKTRWAAFALIVFVIVATAYFHMNFSDPNQLTMFFKNIAIIGGLLLLKANGPGNYSLDAVMMKKTTM